MKTLLLICTFISGIVLGGAAGWLLTTIHFGISSARLMRATQERSVWQYGTNAFTAYLEGPPDAAVFALRYHLQELDEQQRAWGTNWYAFLSAKELARMRVAANARLAILCRQHGRPQEASNYLERAWQSLHGFKSMPTGVTNKEGLIIYFQQEDKKGNWL